MGVLYANNAGVWEEIGGVMPAPPVAPSTDAGNDLTAGSDGASYFKFPATYDALKAMAAT